MKCQQCGYENPDSATVCEQCQTELVKEEGNLTATAVETNEETPKKEKKPLPKITIKPETKEKVGHAMKEALHYIVQMILHPKQEIEMLSWGAMGFITLCIAFVHILWLYILQKGCLTMITMMTYFMPVRLPIKMSLFSTIMGGILITVIVLALIAVLVAISQMSNKEKFNIKRCVTKAINIHLVPTMLLLIGTVIAAFWFNAGIVCFVVVFIALFMNIVFLFKNSNTYLAYIVVTLAMVLLIVTVFYIIRYCISTWTINGADIDTFFDSIIHYYFSV